MSIPDYETLMLPVLKATEDGLEHRLHDVATQIADQFGLGEDERQRLLPSGQQTVISSRVGWARTYLKMAGLLESPARGKIRITPEGRNVLDRNLPRIDSKFLEQYPSYLDFKNRRRTNSKQENTTTTAETSIDDTTPEEALEAAYRDLRNALADDILDQVKKCSPQFFERLVVDLLVAMGYGGSLADAGRAIGRTGDEGIDGIINEDKLGLDAVCIQAKRWSDRTVGRPEVQAFAGSMEGYRAKKGVFITTSTFSKEAYDYIKRIERKIVLIDGSTLAELMVDYDIGVTTSRRYLLKRIDTDYFLEEET